jgi:alkylated DNA nucleotide flippase Atl1
MSIDTPNTKVVTVNGKRRPYVKVTPEIEGEVLAAQRVLGIAASYDDIEKMTGIPARSVKYILTDLPRLRRTEVGDEAAAKSLKARVYDLIETLGEVKDVLEVKRLLGTGDDEHSIMHVLHSLHTQGRIDFTERGNGMGTATAVNIHLAKRGPKPKPVEPEPVLAEGDYDIGDNGAVIPAEPSNIGQPDVEHPVYPLLHDLAQREWRRAVGDPKANAYLSAATSLEHVDPTLAAEMMAKAEALAEPFPSPIEAEYLRYATANPPHGEG